MGDNKELDVREKEDLINALNLADSVVYKNYLSHLNDREILECPSELQNSDLNDFVRFFKIERFVYEKNENSRDKLVSVFHAVASCGGSVIVLIDSDGDKINYYFGAKVPHEEDVAPSKEVLEKSLPGNFPGTIASVVSGSSALGKLTTSVFKNHRNSDEAKHICTITGIPGLRAKEENHEKLFIQGMEKLVDSMRGEIYSLLLIADPVNREQVDIEKQGYENLYSQIFPFSGIELTYGKNESENISKSLTKGVSKSISKSVTDSLTHTKGSFRSHTHTISHTISGGVTAQVSVAPGVSVGGYAGYSHGRSNSDTSGTSENTAIGNAIAIGTVIGNTEQEGVSTGKQTGTSEALQIKFENKTIKNLLEKIDLQLKRIDESADIGMWNCSVYCLADDPATCKIVASSYQSLLRGESSSIETGTITEWDTSQAVKLLPWLEKMHHPKLLFADNLITPASFISGNELTIYAGIPQNSVGGLPVFQMAPFGREISYHLSSDKDNKEQYGNKITLGNIYHMGNEESLPVILNKKSLTSHTFITGSTGSGKSNTVYQLLNEIKSGGHFLVIEPAKGEYKNVFGNREDVSVYGTNPALTLLLKINPFSFPKTIHVLEHLDRLVEIFNVCWPMYAAMPAILKDAIEKSYEQVGWDLPSSTYIPTNKSDSVKYPTFANVTENIRKILDSSDYEGESKGNYKGALITRLKSLTNGINGMIFTDDELSNDELFDENVIVDLSRVPSTETKALIMGILIMKLQEYRQTSGKMNAPLHHITVLEEAHNLLKRTSTEQSSETANLLGKSVEMLANAIAEMRTYGEGFIIADQSPGLLDMSVIRNTNTKIILRLPDEGDRVLVGKAAGLNDDQIVELAKLQIGVAAVYQNDWIQPVLCMVEEFKYDKNLPPYQKADTKINEKIRNVVDLKKYAQNEEIDKNELKEKIEAVDIADFKKLGQEFIASLFKNNEKVFIEATKTVETEKTKLPGLKGYLVHHLEPSLSDYKIDYSEYILTCIVLENCRKDKSLSELPEMWSDFISRKEASKNGKF